LKIPKKHRGPHKRSSRATCGPRVWDPWCRTYLPVWTEWDKHLQNPKSS